MSKDATLAVEAVGVPVRTKPSVYPAPFKERMEGREKRVLGDVFGLKNFGVNLTTLQPGAQSALMHRHSKQDEFVYVLHGTIMLHTPEGQQALTAGMCAGFPAGGVAHHLINETNAPATFLEVGDRRPGDSAVYPQDDLIAELSREGHWVFKHKNGALYP